ncbi:MAG: hypothetical protein HZC28_19655 [Spirochaetes bacterium]|nr:hypothetical protein [Spirochaetota bacterium]
MNSNPGSTRSPNDFPGGTQTARIIAALDALKAHGGGTLELAADTISLPNTNTWTITESIVLASNTTLYLNHCRLKLADGVYDTIIRNEGIVIDEANPNGFARELKRDSNIKIIGSGIDSAFIEGPDIQYAAPHPVRGGKPVPWIGDYFGWRTISILFANVHGYEIGGFSMRKTTCWAISQEHGCEDMHIHDIDFLTTVKNGDGIDFRKGCRNGLVERITGACADDVIACTALGGFTDFPKKTVNSNEYYNFPLEVGGRSARIEDDVIENIEIRDIKASSKCHTIICLAGGGPKVRNITATDVEDNMTYAALQVVAVYTGYGTSAASGDISNVHMKNIISNNSPMTLLVNAPLENSSFDAVVQRKAGGKTYQIQPPYDTQMKNVRITDAAH